MTNPNTCAGCFNVLIAEPIERDGKPFCDLTCYGWMLGRQESDDVIKGLRRRLVEREAEVQGALLDLRVEIEADCSMDGHVARIRAVKKLDAVHARLALGAEGK